MTDAELRILDAKVAEFMEWDGCHVIHYCEDTWYNYCRNDGCYESGASDDNIMMWDGGDPPIPGCKGYPPYSTDISAAWLVVEKMNGNVYIIRYQDTWRVTCGDPKVCETAPTAPEAICLAALASVEDE